MAGRRPIAARQTHWAQQAAALLANAGVAPNQISIASVFLAGVGAASFIVSGGHEGALRYALLWLGACCIPLRLLCNMLDGMVAVEHGKQSMAGEVYNEFPDRIADALFLIGAGYAAAQFDWLVAVGWSAAVLAVLTAYTRTLGVAVGAGNDFSGPFAKQQRMAVLAAGCALAPLQDLWGGEDYVLAATLVLIAAGSALTTARRLSRLLTVLEKA